MDIIDFYYFSGTGNTFLVVEAMKEVFIKSGIEVNLLPIEGSNPGDIDYRNSIGLAFPVAMQGTYPFIWDFINALPKVHGTKIFMVDTLQAFSGGVVGPVGRILRRKGYKTISAKEIYMPSNYSSKELDEKKSKLIVEKGLLKAKKYAHEIVGNRGYWGYIPILSDMVSLLSVKKKPWEFFVKVFNLKVDEKLCTKCNICVDICPINAIKMEDYPTINSDCRLCMRCVSFCPTNAINSVNSKLSAYKAVNLKDIRKQRI